MQTEIPTQQIEITLDDYLSPKQITKKIVLENDYVQIPIPKENVFIKTYTITHKSKTHFFVFQLKKTEGISVQFEGKEIRVILTDKSVDGKKWLKDMTKKAKKVSNISFEVRNDIDEMERKSDDDERRNVMNLNDSDLDEYEKNLEEKERVLNEMEKLLTQF